MATMIRRVSPMTRNLSPLIFAVGILLFGGCELFHDPALPPFSDRVVLTRSINDVFALSTRTGVEMTVVDNGTSSFLLIRGPGRDGSERVVAFDTSLRIRMNRTDLWNIPFAAPDANGDIVIGNTLFSGSAFSVIDPGLPVPGDFALVSSAADNALVSVTEDAGEPVDSALRIEIVFQADWVTAGTADETYPIFPDPWADPPLSVALGGFELLSSQHDPGRDRSGVVLWNQVLARHFVVVLRRSAVTDPLPPPGPDDYLNDLEDATVVPLPTQDRYQRVYYTRRGIVVVGYDGDHEVYSLTGNRTARFRVNDRDDYEYAYAPDGEWMYIIDRTRGRLSRASTWW